jgi:porin
VGWARPTNRPLFRSQYTLEAFYRFMLTPNFAITPDLQCIIDPALTPALARLTRTRNVNDVLWIVGLRTRLTF